MNRLDLEWKAAVAVNDAGTISGIAWPFGTPDRLGDVIEKGAFREARTPLPMLFGHDQNEPVGIWNGIEEKQDGLHVTGKLLVDEVRRAREVLALVKSGAVGGLSVGFLTKVATSRKGGGRTITDLQLLEVSLVAIPAHPGARVTSAKAAVDAMRIAEALNRATHAFSIL